jgi:hypothetical protein
MPTIRHGPTHIYQHLPPTRSLTSQSTMDLSGILIRSESKSGVKRAKRPAECTDIGALADIYVTGTGRDTIGTGRDGTHRKGRADPVVDTQLGWVEGRASGASTLGSSLLKRWWVALHQQVRRVRGRYRTVRERERGKAFQRVLFGPEARTLRSHIVAACVRGSSVAVILPRSRSFL